MAVIEFARNEFGWKDAQSTEFDKDTAHPMVHLLHNVCIYTHTYYLYIHLPYCKVIEMPEHNPGQMGGTMRLGKRRTVFTNQSSLMSECVLALVHNTSDMKAQLCHV